MESDLSLEELLILDVLKQLRSKSRDVSRSPAPAQLTPRKVGTAKAGRAFLQVYTSE